MESQSEVKLVLVTAGSEKNAVLIARALVEQGLAACANLVPYVRSIYRWEGAVQDEPEVLLVIKTSSRHLQRVEAEVKRLHTYDTPEILSVSPEQVSKGYLRWWLDNLG